MRVSGARAQVIHFCKANEQVTNSGGERERAENNSTNPPLQTFAVIGPLGRILKTCWALRKAGHSADGRRTEWITEVKSQKLAGVDTTT
jgi:hypothetical protein